MGGLIKDNDASPIDHKNAVDGQTHTCNQYMYSLEAAKLAP